MYQEYHSLPALFFLNLIENTYVLFVLCTSSIRKIEQFIKGLSCTKHIIHHASDTVYYFPQ